MPHKGKGYPSRGQDIEPVADNPHVIERRFQSDKFPTTPLGLVPLATHDPDAADLLWIYAQRRRRRKPGRDGQDFADALEWVLREEGYDPPTAREAYPTENFPRVGINQAIGPHPSHDPNEVGTLFARIDAEEGVVSSYWKPVDSDAVVVLMLGGCIVQHVMTPGLVVYPSKIEIVPALEKAK